MFGQSFLAVLTACIALAVCSLSAMAEVSRVVVAPIEASHVQGNLALAGELVAIRSTVLSAEIAGSVDEIFAESGDRVEPDALLARIREEPARLALQALRARIDEARAGVERAQINERRLSRLLPRKAVSQDEYDAARVELARTQAILASRIAESGQQAERLERHHIQAPFAATIAARHIELGQWLNVGDPCYELNDTSTLRAILDVPQQYYAAVREGSTVKVRYDALPGEEFDLVITRKLPTVRSAGRSFEIWMDIDNAGLQLVPGLSLRAEMPLAMPEEEQWLVPRDAVVRLQGGQTQVWLAEKVEGASAARSLKVDVAGAVDTGLIVRSANLRPGMQVVTRGNESLREGQEVKIVDAR
jgi:RND family efflux transporter MFP subunit